MTLIIANVRSDNPVDPLRWPFVPNLSPLSIDLTRLITAVWPQSSWPSLSPWLILFTLLIHLDRKTVRHFAPPPSYTHTKSCPERGTWPRDNFLLEKDEWKYTRKWEYQYLTMFQFFELPIVFGLSHTTCFYKLFLKENFTL
jgi:hypothetical protein